MQPQVVSVREVVEYLRLLTESDAFLSNLWIEGELLSVKRANSGHFYLTLGDSEASLKAVAWRMDAVRFQHHLVQGARVIVGGRMSVYAKTGEVQLYVEHADAIGTGIQALELARLRGQLESDGLFDAARKRPLPSFPRVVGLVTSPTGAVLHDVQTVMRRRFPLARLLVSAAQVQGSGAVDSLLAAIDLLIADKRSDVIIIARGGGSAEDLSAFNDERLARAVFASPIPIISAIGHETDVTIIDEVADLRAPTPSAAAELATPDIADFAFDLIESRERLGISTRRHIELRRVDLLQAEQRIDWSSPLTRHSARQQQLTDFTARLGLATRVVLRAAQADCRVSAATLRGLGLRTVDAQRANLSGQTARMPVLARANLAAERSGHDQRDSRLRAGSRALLQQAHAALDLQRSSIYQLNPIFVLDRGFALLTDVTGHVVGSVNGVASGDSIQAVVRDGTISSNVTAVAHRGSPGTR